MRYYAHRTRRHLLVVELELLGEDPSHCRDVHFTSQWDGTAGGSGAEGSRCGDAAYTTDLKPIPGSLHAINISGKNPGL